MNARTKLVDTDEVMKMDLVRGDSLECKGVHRADRQAPEIEVSIRVYTRMERG